MSLGYKISKERKKQNITQEQFAQLLDVSRQSVSRWESDVVYPEIDKLIMVSEILNVSCDYLLKDDLKENHAIINPVTRLLKDAIGKKIKIDLFEEYENYSLLNIPCKILDFDRTWVELEIYRGKQVEKKLIQISSIATIAFVEEK